MSKWEMDDFKRRVKAIEDRETSNAVGLIVFLIFLGIFALGYFRWGWFS